MTTMRHPGARLANLADRCRNHRAAVRGLLLRPSSSSFSLETETSVGERTLEMAEVMRSWTVELARCGDPGVHCDVPSATTRYLEVKIRAAKLRWKSRQKNLDDDAPGTSCVPTSSNTPRLHFVGSASSSELPLLGVVLRSDRSRLH